MLAADDDLVRLPDLAAQPFVPEIRRGPEALDRAEISNPDVDSDT